MVTVTDLPRVEPLRLARPLTPDEVLTIANLQHVPGVDPDDPCVQAIRWARVGIHHHETMRQAREYGYLIVSRSAHRVDPDEPIKLITLWGWWCAAAGRPEILIDLDAGDDMASLRCDMSPTGRRWSFPTLWDIIHLVEPFPLDDEYEGWMLTPDELHIDRMAMDDALTVARALARMDLARLPRDRR